MDYIKEFPENQRIRFGDICVIYISESQRLTFKIEQNAELQSKFGLIRANDLLGHPYGIRFECKRGWILPLRLTPESWTQLLPHRTQILYQADISLILLQLDIKPGTIVVESGTGSGSMSHAILRACRPHGFLHTFDVDSSRVQDAQKEFDTHGLGQNVKVVHRNVCELGFGDNLANSVDAVILDLPRTWDAIGHAHKVLKPDGSRLCTFSPCIEQVQQNVAKMNELKMKDIVTYECLIRPFHVQVSKMRVWTDEILDGLVALERKRYENLKNRLNPAKRTKIEEDGSTSQTNDDHNADATKIVGVVEYEYHDLESLNKALNDPKISFNANMLPKRSHTFAQQQDETISHSGYLTFASKRK